MSLEQSQLDILCWNKIQNISDIPIIEDNGLKNKVLASFVSLLSYKLNGQIIYVSTSCQLAGSKMLMTIFLKK